MNVFQYFHLRFEMEQQNHQSEKKVFELSDVGKMSWNVLGNVGKWSWIISDLDI